ncbi:helix-turn-helix domain-containing protein [Methylocystis sp.]|uniref:helix-turn-helix domain-containing protein n=1 Tax=Methylocystis sp. TaxID=1911079 RepID=UPI0023B8939E|nr:MULTISPECIES: helix-turn-helix domain-containing protein [Methylocystis]
MAVYREGERAERGGATLDEAAEALNVSSATIRRLIADGALPASQHCKGAPYAILAADLRRTDVVKEAAARRKRSSRPPPSANQPDLPIDFQ